MENKVTAESMGVMKILLPTKRQEWAVGIKRLITTALDVLLNLKKIKK